MIDKLVAADLAALATDSQQRIGTFESFVPAPRIVVVRKPRVLDPIRTRVNRIALLACFGTTVACLFGLATSEVRDPFRYLGVDQRELAQNTWFLRLAAIALVATSFLVAHRLATRVLGGSADWRARTQRLGDTAFGIAVVVWVVGWFGWLVVTDSMWNLNWGPNGVSFFRGHWDDVATDCWFSIVAGLAISLTSRAFAVGMARSARDRWSGAATSLFWRLAGIAALAGVLAMPQFQTNAFVPTGWKLWPISELQSELHYLRVAEFHVGHGWYDRPERLSSAQVHVLFGVLLAFVVVGVCGVLAVRERHTQCRSRVFAVIEHRAVLGVALTIGFLSVVVPQFMQNDISMVPMYEASVVSIVAIAVWAAFDRRRATLRSLENDAATTRPTEP